VTGVQVAPDARDAVLRLLYDHTVAKSPTLIWEALAEALISAAITDPPVTAHQLEIDGEYVASLRAQRRAAELQAEHSQRLAALVERSEVLAEMQIELARRQLEETPQPFVVDDPDPGGT
jgi:hypothetical protein